MSTARCKSCHCYIRNCPPGLPNHKNYQNGQNCMMNSSGRHYRDPLCPDDPTCNYEAGGVVCSFFTEDNDLAKLPYPSDITLGPVSDPEAQEPNPNQNNSLGAIFTLLMEQKADFQKYQAENSNKMQQLQNQMNGLLKPAEQSSTSVTVSSGSQTTSSVVSCTAASTPVSNTTVTFSSRTPSQISSNVLTNKSTSSMLGACP